MIDPITLSVVRSSLEQICDEMDLHLIRSALSPIISETNDCAHGIYEARTGETIAQGHVGLPVFLANMQFAVQATMAAAEGDGGFRPGDVWILNDTYRGGTHLNDVNLVVPVFVGDEIFAFIASTGHWMDLGGSAPGGWNPTAQEIHQEGVIIPPVRLVDGGRRNDALIATIMANVRLPRDIMGDLTAMRSAVETGEQRLRDVVARHGEATVRACLSEMIDRSEQQMRSYVEEIPDGRYRFVDWVDNDGVVDEPIKIQVEVAVRGSDMTIDFAGTAGTALGPVNVARSTTVSLCYVALKHIFPDVPINGGTFRPAEILVPEGSVLCAEYPAPVSGYLETAGRVIDVMFGALAQAIPDRVPAASFGTVGVVTVAGMHPDRGTYFIGVFPYPGGYGASSDSDGLVHGTPSLSMANFVSLEASEHRYPVRFDFFALRDGSGGAGRHRGGNGSSYRVSVLAPTVVSVLGDRADHRPFGLQGGDDAMRNRVTVTTAGREWEPPMKTKLASEPLAAGDALTVASPGGGGYGDPMLRPVAAVEHDLNLGYIDRDTAERVYGVVVDTVTLVIGRPRYRLDVARSAERREAVRRAAEAKA